MPSAYNDVVTVTITIVWTNQLVTVLKNGSRNQLATVELGAFSVEHVLKAILEGSNIQIVFGADDISAAFEEQKWIQEHAEVPPGTMSQIWKSMLGVQ
jgi:hypothetical protein